MPIDTLLTFVIASALLAFSPGPDNLFVMTQSAVHGYRAGIFIVLGLCTGLIGHTMAVALGVAAIFQTSALAFTVLKTLGAVYLLFLAWQAFRAGRQDMLMAESGLSPKRLYWRGIITNLTNPKVAIFFLAFLPQFIQTSPAAGGTVLPITLQLMLLGCVFIVTAMVVFLSIALLAGYLSSHFKRSPRVQIILNRVAGLVFVGLAAKLMASER